jgi:hypothetical protein
VDSRAGVRFSANAALFFKTVIALPSIPKLIQRTKALAALDLIFSPEWQYRYYSYNSAWALGQEMATMRNGSGDEWWLVFHRNGWAALKGLGHESKTWSKGGEKLSKALNSALPTELADFANEPAFRWDASSFAYFARSNSAGWTRAGDLTSYASESDTGEAELLKLLIEPPQAYVSFVEEYFEKSVPLEVVTSIFDLRPITPDLVNSLNPEITLDDISPELFEEIGYPTNT